MDGLYYYPFSRVYLRDRMEQISLGLVKFGIYSTSAFFVAALLYWLAAFINNLF